MGTFEITELSDTHFQLKWQHPVSGITSNLGFVGYQNKYEVIADIRNTFLQYLVNSTLDLASVSGDKAMSESAKKYADWVYDFVMSKNAKYNFKVAVDQWIILHRWLTKIQDPRYQVFFLKLYDMSLAFMLHWSDPKANPLPTKLTTNKAA